MNLYRINKSVIHEWWLCLFQLWRLFITYSCQHYEEFSLRKQIFFFLWDLYLDCFWWSVAFQPYPVGTGDCEEHLGVLGCYSIPFFRRERVGPLICFTNICSLAGRAGMVCLTVLMLVDMIAVQMGANSCTDTSPHRLLCSLCTQINFYG